MADKVPWTKRRQLYAIEILIFLVCMIVGVVLAISVHGLGHQLLISGAIFVVLVAHLILRQTYFRNVIPEIRQERENRRSVG